MAWNFSVMTLVGGVAAVISGLVALYSWRHRSKRMAIPFLALEITLATWSLVYAIQLGYGTLGEQIVWQRISLGIAGFVPTFWVLFAFTYTGRDDWLTRRRATLLLLEPIAFLSLCLTNQFHGLIWSGAAMTATGLGAVPALEFGIGYIIHIAYGYTIVAAGIGLLVLHATQIAPAYQNQIGLLVVGTIPPFLSHISFTFGESPIPALDLTPFLFAFTGAIFGLALFRFDLLELAPIARTQAFRDVGDGLIIINNDGEIMDLVGVTAEVLTPTPRVGDDISDVFPETSLEELDESEVTATIEGERRVYQFQVSSLSAYHDQQVGHILILREITGLRESKQRLSVSNRVLRHNLRNDMNVVLGYARRLESRLEGQDAREARKIRERVEEFMELAKKAEQIADVHANGGDTGTTINLSQHLRDAVDDLQTEHPSVEFRMNHPSGITVEGVDPETFRLAIRNVLDNAIEHNDTPDPWVSIEVDENGDETRIEISDNGPGIPETEQEAIGASLETPLEHSQGLGLWLTYWCATRWGGDLLIDSTSDGSTVTLTIPKSGSSELSETSLGDVPV